MRTAIAAVGLAGGLMCLVAPPAMAGDLLNHAGFGYIKFDDNGDIYTVCDSATDHIGVAGRISVKQADGSWYHFAWRRDGTGNDEDCAGNNVDVLREQAEIRLTICRQNGPDGRRYDCQ